MKTLITGADGYIGLKLARRLLETEHHSVILWVRAKDDAEFQDKKTRMEAQLGEAMSTGRAYMTCGELREAEPFVQVDPASIDQIIHSASVTKFNVDADTALRVNVEGTQKVLEFASRCPSLRNLAYLSTVYASGRKTGNISEAALCDTAGFVNFYEKSKWESERLLMERYSHLPWRIFRIATAICDDSSGKVVQQNVFHNTVKLLYYGLLSIIPGHRDTPIYLVTGEFIAEAIAHALPQSKPHEIFHVAHSRAESLTLGQLMDVVFEAFEQDPGFASRRILKPLFSDQQAFDLLVEGLSSFSGGIVNQAISSMAPFAHQLFIPKQVQNDRLIAAFQGYRAPDQAELIRSTCKYLLKTKFGVQPHAAP